MFETRCTWIPHEVANSDGFVNEHKFDVLSKDIYADLRKIYRKLRTKGAEQLDNDQEAAHPASHDVPVISKGFGGSKQVNVNDNRFKIMANFATTALRADSDYKRLVLDKIIKAEAMAGRNYRLTLQLTNQNAADLPGETLICNVLLYDHSSIESFELLSFSCSATKKQLAPSTGTDIVTEILLAIKGRKELLDIANYLNTSRDSLRKALPLVRPGISNLFVFPFSFLIL